MAQKHPKRYSGKNITIGSVKRLMGKKGETGWGWWKTYPQEVSAFILAELKYQAERYLGQEVKQAVIAIPSHFDESQRRATKEAAEIAGLESVRLLNEATAAVIAYGFRKRSEEKVLVFDFGGGTLDVSIVDFGEGVFEVFCIEGDSKLGGDDFDQIIIDYILDQVHQKYGVEMELEPFQKMILKEAAEQAKIELSSTLNASIHIPGFLHIGKSYYDLDVSIDRQTFERLSKSLFERAIRLIRSGLDSAKLQSSDLNALLLLGGSSRIPYIRESIRREFKIEPCTGVNPETCVAQGAIIQAALLGGMFEEDFVLMDVIPSSYGIETLGGVFSPIIYKDTTAPTKKSEIFTTTEDNQTAITVKFYQGERPMASDNIYLSTVELRGIPPSPRGTPQIKVTFDVDSNMIVHVSAKDLGTEKEQNVVVKSPYGLNNAQIKLMQQKLKSWLSERRILEFKPQIDSLRSSIEGMLSKGTTPLDWVESSALRRSSASLCELLEKGVHHEELETAISNTQSIYEKAQPKISQYENVINEINDLMASIEKFILVVQPIDEREACLLTQGKDLLKDFVNQSFSSEELQKMLSSVRSEYVGTKANLIKRALEDLETSEQMEMWVAEVKNSLSDLSTISHFIARLREFQEIDFILVSQQVSF